jgi:geranylgeranyl pyrophosphate synthase
MTLPLIRALALGTPEEADVIRHAVAGGGLTDFAPVVAALHRTGALAYARERAEAEAAEIGKNLGDDLSDGKMTLPLIRALALGTPDEAEVIRHAVAGGGLTDFAPVVAALHRTGALAYARERAEAEAAAAAACLAVLPASAAAKSLLQLSTFAARRSY